MIPSIEQEIRDLHALLGSTHDPEGRAFVPLADAYRRAGDPDRALEVLARGLDRHPDLAAGYLMKALAFRDLADDAGAESAYREVLSRDGDNARALVGLGRLMRAAGQDEEAERLIQRGVALDPRLASEGTPDRVPRHSTNPEVVSPEALAPLEWEVLEPMTEPETDVVSDEVPLEVAPDEVRPEVVSDEVPLEVAPDEVLPEVVSDEVPLEVASDEVLPEVVSDEVLPEVVSDEVLPEVVSDEVLPEVVSDEVLPEVASVEMPPEMEIGPSTPGETAALESSGEPAPTHVETETVTSDAAASAIGSLEPVVDLDGGAASGSGGLDIEWEVEEFYGAVGAPSGGDAAPSPDSPEEREPVVADSGGDELIVDAWTLAPDGWTPDSEMPEAAALDLADLAPDDGDDLAPDDGDAAADAAADDDAGDEVDADGDEDDDADGTGSFDSQDEDGEDAVLPTRTLGELYARQGLTAEAMQVFKELAEANPDNLEHRARLLELEAELSGEGRRAAAARSPAVSEVAVPDDPPISAFFDALLTWTSDDTTGGVD